MNKDPLTNDVQSHTPEMPGSSEPDCESDNSNSGIGRTLAAASLPMALGAFVSGCGSTRSEVVLPEVPGPCNPAMGDCGPVATGFQDIIDREMRTTFTREDESHFFDWVKIAIASSNINRVNSDKAIINLLNQCRQYVLGFPVNTLEHCLQTATRAVNDNATDELVLAALLHDIGIAFSYHGHAAISAAIIRPAVSESVYRVVMHHHEFELAHYGHLIGEPTDMRELYAHEDWYPMAEEFVDNWVQVSYDPGFPSLPLEEFLPLIKERFSGFRPSDMEVTMRDCFIETTP
ncbi:MAG: HD domain-containing protein [Ketobacteraceae bacterium]|nr:HD domain-containing protein [Ketobacteraceae bacterium]